ncbi:N-acetyltransferase [Lactobacillus sp. DCY120]|uniref:N-acetyltransferase n=1 Tax=Bombilactobacillus apium TaxID=2675299 RepID=A0A850R9C2_9LACO|nr:GNAT family N-acetyltransferase [Bombilactobacillus apium]NVY95996.1 N-acetyltransferase [Bombilactobacillus apium]
MKFKHQAGCFYQEDAQKHLIGKITYTHLKDQVISIDSTFVDPNYRNQGIARALLEEVIQRARQKYWHIIPVCPYARIVFERESQLQDLLQPVKKEDQDEAK